MYVSLYVTTFNDAQGYICLNQQCRFEHISNITSINYRCDVALCHGIYKNNPTESLGVSAISHTATLHPRGDLKFPLSRHIYLQNDLFEESRCRGPDSHLATCVRSVICGHDLYVLEDQCCLLSDTYTLLGRIHRVLDPNA